MIDDEVVSSSADSNKEEVEIVCNLTARDRAFFQRFIPYLYRGDHTVMQRYNECEKISAYVLNKVLSGSGSQMESESGMIVERKGDYVVNEYVGRGSFGYVMNVLNRVTAEEYVLKLIAVRTDPLVQVINDTSFGQVATLTIRNIEREFEMQGKLSREFDNDRYIKIPKIYRMKRMNGLYGVLMEKINKQEYFNFPLTFARGVESERKWKHHLKLFLNCIGFALNRLHSRGYVHGDVAYRNLMYGVGEGGKFKIVFFDFGRCLELARIGNGYNRVLLKLYDYYCVLFEMLRGVSNRNDFMYASDCLASMYRNYYKSILRTNEFLVEEEDRTTLFAIAETIGQLFSDLGGDRSQEDELYRKKERVVYVFLRGSVFYDPQGGRDRVNYFSLFNYIPVDDLSTRSRSVLKKKSKSVRFGPSSKVLLIDKDNLFRSRYDHKLGGKTDKIEEEVVGRNYDFTDRAATKIQALFRGHKLRKSNEAGIPSIKYKKNKDGLYIWNFKKTFFEEKNFRSLIDTFQIKFVDFDNYEYMWRNTSRTLVLITSHNPLYSEPSRFRIISVSVKLFREFIKTFRRLSG
jgi:tRNA A-37 threonylcarbamoyl transferase component Bud32